ncbi:HAD-IC family P-type ATPase [Chitinimonas sp. PSY-7]|uniref:HAD-IC family P-type ATPase n=1 Tax=Chitinimonas sp. PSY-7 TaxID=3459088 RepID=UPI00403FFBA3
MSDWHALQATQVTELLKVDPDKGLDDHDASERLRTHGPNRLNCRSERSPLLRFATQILQPMILVLITAGTVTVLLGEWVEASVIFGVVLINALAGFIQEGKAEAALMALAESVATETTVVRDGTHRKLNAIEIVPGDLVVLASGNKVPADLRLLASKALRTIEATLTGESAAVSKSTAVQLIDTPLAERQNMAFAGTLVVGGQGIGVVTATGVSTETGRLSQLISQAPVLTTPLMRKMNLLIKHLLLVILVLAALSFAIGVLRGEATFDMFMAAVALAVGAIPEGLPAAMTITLAIGVARLAKHQAIIRKLPAVETLGSTTVICSDKTGTLTENAMTVREIWAGMTSFSVSGQGYEPSGGIVNVEQPATVSGALREVLLAGVLCNDARLLREGQNWTVAGDPTEAALLVAARKGGLDDTTLNTIFPRLDELPFDPDRQYMATLHEIEGIQVICVKGAVEKLLPACTSMLDSQGHELPLVSGVIQATATRMADDGLRVLALVRSELGPNQQLEHANIGSGLVFLGLVGMLDQPRPRAIAAVRTCYAAGIRVKMITGDHPGTARAIARQLGIIGYDGQALTGGELACLDESALRKAVIAVDVFARVEPEQKLRLVRALQANGEVVAMTGDGVNDAPALKQADIGIAMGLGGTEVAKEAAAMVLTNDNFATIETAIKAGRGIYDNLIKFLVWTIPTNAGEGLVIFTALCTGTTLPITPLQILWINMTTAILLGLMLAFEPVERGIMQRPPRLPTAPVLERELILRILMVGFMLLLGAFGMFELALYWGHSLPVARTIACNVFVMVEIFYLFNCRSLTQPCWVNGWFTNQWIWIGSGTMLLLQLAFTYLPIFNQVFQTAPIEMLDWVSICTYSTCCALIVEVEKHWRLAQRKPHKPVHP